MGNAGTGRAARPASAPGGRRINGPLLALAIVILATVGFFGARFYLGTEPAGVMSTGGASIGGPFTLTDQDGRTVTDKDFHGRWMLVYFGFTFCPDVCPTSLGRNGDALDLLGEKAAEVVPVLITVDPGRDTPEKLKDYVHFFHPRTVGLTGTAEQVAAVAKEYRVYYAKARSQGATDAYLVDHSSFTYLIGPDGRFVQFFRHEASPQEVADRLKSLL
jgi:protein SCO1/2